MSIFPMPEQLMPNADKIHERAQKLTDELSAMAPKTPQDAMALMANPLAMAAATSTAGFTIASHMMGFWTDVLTPDAAGTRAETAFRTPRTTTERGMAAMETLRADMEQGARHASEGAGKAMREVAADAERAVTNAAAVAEIVVEKQKQAFDDLKSIAGIGPKLETVLNGMGIASFSQIATLTEAQVAALDDKLGFKGRILRDDWIGQARRLAGLDE